MPRSPSRQVGLVVQGVTHAFGKTVVVRDANLTVAAGEIHCLLGPSGSGKTTLLRLIAGLERLQTGRIEIDGEDVATASAQSPPEARSIGFVFQDYALFPHLNVRDNVMFGMAGGQRAARLERTQELLERVGMSRFESAMPHTLSGGQQQRVAVARAMARDPKIMLLDEPFSGLDARLRDDVRQATVDVLKSANVATVMVTHDPQEAMLVADRISIIHEGCIEQTGSPQELYERPVTTRVATSLGEANCYFCTVKDGALATPLGVMPAGDLTEGQLASIVLRPNAIRVTSEPVDGGVRATIRGVRFIGAAARIEAETSCGAVVVALVESDRQMASPEVFLSVAPGHAAVICP